MFLLLFFFSLNNSFCQPSIQSIHSPENKNIDKEKRRHFSFGSMVNSQIVNANSSFIYQSLFCRLVLIYIKVSWYGKVRKDEGVLVCVCVHMLSTIYDRFNYVYYNFIHFSGMKNGRLDKYLPFGNWEI